MSDVVCCPPCLVRNASVPPETSSTCSIARWPGWRSLKSKSCPVQSDEHLLTVLRYVERNPVRAQSVARAEQRRWGSAWARRPGAAPCWLVKPRDPALPRPWLRWVREPQTDAEFRVLRNCLRRSCPFGDEGWATSSAARLDLQSTVRPRGRSQKESVFSASRDIKRRKKGDIIEKNSQSIPDSDPCDNAHRRHCGGGAGASPYC